MKFFILTSAMLSMSLFTLAQTEDKFSYLDSTQNAVIREVEHSSFIKKEESTIDNIENIDPKTTRVIFRIQKSDTERYRWIKCTFKNNKCISTEYTTPIDQLGYMFYFLAQDFDFSKDAKTLMHKNLDIKGQIDYDFKLKYYSIIYTHKK